MRVDNHAISQKEIESYFINFQNRFIELIAEIRNDTDLLTLTRLLVNFLFIKEEINALNHVRYLIDENQGKFNEVLINEIIFYLGLQQEAYRNFIYLSHPSYKNFYEEAVKSDSFQDIENFKTFLIQTPINQLVNQDSVGKQFYNLNERIQNLDNLKYRFLDLMQREINTIWKNAKRNLFLIGLFFLLFALATYLITSLLVKTITHSLENAVFVAKQVSRGHLKDLALDCRTSRGDEIGDLERALCVMVGTLYTLNHELKQEIESLAGSGTEILTAVTQASSGTSEIATALTETSTTMEELKQTSHLASEKAKDVLTSTGQAINTLQSSEASLKSTLNDMQNIQTRMGTIVDSIVKLSKHSQAIGDIINTVNDLAGQSNLLAVNAAIEAAKAGEQGKGFSVVAQEVRRLAEQSKEATAQVHNLLGDIQNAISSAVMSAEQGTKAVEQGVGQSAKTSEELRLLSIDINEFKRAADQIAVSSEQQLIGIDQVAVAMNNIKEASNQHVGQMQQIKQAINTLNDISQSLKKAVNQYKV